MTWPVEVESSGAAGRAGAVGRPRPGRAGGARRGGQAARGGGGRRTHPAAAGHRPSAAAEPAAAGLRASRRVAEVLPRHRRRPPRRRCPARPGSQCPALPRGAGRAVGETANLAVREGDDVVYIAQVSSPHTLRMFAEVGRHVPPHSTAVGKVLLAALPRDQALGIVRRAGLAPPHPDHDHRPDRVRCRARPGRERRAGRPTRRSRRAGCAASPYPSVGPAPTVAAMSLSGPADRFAGGRTDGLVAEMQRIGQEFGAGT